MRLGSSSAASPTPTSPSCFPPGACRAVLVLPGDRLVARPRGALRVARRRYTQAGVGWLAPTLFGAFSAAQCAAAYRHAMDYRDDVTFWEATKKSRPAERQGAPQLLGDEGRRAAISRCAWRRVKTAIDLAPEWAMARVYTGDTLCRMHRSDEAWEYYKKGFERGPNELSLIALALQCMWDEKELMKHEDELRALAYEERFKGTWLAYLAIDTLDNGEQNKGVDPKYRPRGYNEGPKDSTSE